MGLKFLWNKPICSKIGKTEKMKLKKIFCENFLDTHRIIEKISNYRTVQYDLHSSININFISAGNGCGNKK